MQYSTAICNKIGFRGRKLAVFNVLYTVFPGCTTVYLLSLVFDRPNSSETRNPFKMPSSLEAHIVIFAVSLNNPINRRLQDELLLTYKHVIWETQLERLNTFEVLDMLIGESNFKCF